MLVAYLGALLTVIIAWFFNKPGSPPTAVPIPSPPCVCNCDCDPFPIQAQSVWPLAALLLSLNLVPMTYGHSAKVSLGPACFYACTRHSVCHVNDSSVDNNSVNNFDKHVNGNHVNDSRISDNTINVNDRAVIDDDDNNSNASNDSVNDTSDIDDSNDIDNKNLNTNDGSGIDFSKNSGH